MVQFLPNCPKNGDQSSTERAPLKNGKLLCSEEKTRIYRIYRYIYRYIMIYYYSCSTVIDKL
jgi:hypothetical protein